VTAMIVLTLADCFKRI